MSVWSPEAISGLIGIGAGGLAVVFGWLAGKTADTLLKLKTLAILVSVAGFAIALAIAASKA